MSRRGDTLCEIADVLADMDEKQLEQARTALEKIRHARKEERILYDSSEVDRRTMLLKQLQEGPVVMLGVSNIHGVGVFAVTNLYKGINPFEGVAVEQATDEYEIFTDKDLSTLQPAVRQLCLSFFAPFTSGNGYYSLPEVGEEGLAYPVNATGLNTLDVSWYLNHSEVPNIELIEVAAIGSPLSTSFMRFALTSLLAKVTAIGAAKDDDYTVLSILSGGSMVYVDTIPELLHKVGVEVDGRIATLLSTANIKTLKFAECQIVPTSSGSVSNADLCDYLHGARRHLPDLQVTCGRNIAGEMTQLDDTLHVNDPDAYMQDYLRRMNMGEVWGLIQQYPRREVTVAVIDQGVNFSDPDMAPLRGTFTTSDGKVIDGGWNFQYGNSTLTLGFHHGQRVSRVLAARGNNSAGMVGVAPDHVRLVSLQISGAMSQFLEALDMAIDLGVDVISMSLTYHMNGYSSSEKALLRTALLRAQQRNIVLVSSAGNDNMDAHDCYPCWYGGPSAICVTALNNDANNTLANFSNFGNRVDIAAFGTSIYSGSLVPGVHVWSSGASFATPMVSAGAAILLSLGVQPSRVKSILVSSTDPLQGSNKHIRPRSGALNILSSVQNAIQMYGLRTTNRNLRATS
ncbi:hypothetical protein FOL47_007591 [Perkinsus chesapeaki]|uniref:subtilisin n=1 Tax=Perkinsus chesapeaki TaxID=330153 RepID=A0A7J6LJF2_PERCH|nr:hypothetical protein FOL47_007591 [Perkinsus chesapeaki]